MEPGAECHPGVEHERDRAIVARVRPGWTDEERADANRRERFLPGLEPIRVFDLTHRELADRPEAESLEMSERVAHIGDLREGLRILDEIRLHGVIGAARRVEGQLDGDAVVTETAQDLADRFDSLGVGGDRDLEPARMRA